MKLKGKAEIMPGKGALLSLLQSGNKETPNFIALGSYLGTGGSEYHMEYDIQKTGLRRKEAEDLATPLS